MPFFGLYRQFERKTGRVVGTTEIKLKQAEIRDPDQQSKVCRVLAGKYNIAEHKTHRVERSAGMLSSVVVVQGQDWPVSRRSRGTTTCHYYDMPCDRYRWLLMLDSRR